MIKYQFTTIFPLAGSKSYVNSLLEAKQKLKEVIAHTEAYRKTQVSIDRAREGIKLAVSEYELDASCRLVRIDTELLPQPLEKLFGEERPISDPRKPNE